MEHVLRCNALKCRTHLNDHAVVTTCSHVFCIDCANRLQLSNPPAGQRPICPACDAHLTNPDDAVITNLNPTEDYKTSVLSGLSPNVIMECAGRALSFWAYQITQEVVYQEFLAKSLTEKYTSLNSQMDKIIHQANAEMSDLRVKMNNLLVDQDSLRRKNEELAQAFRDKSRKHSQTQELYDKLKHRVMLGQVQNAASDAVDHTIHSSTVSNRFMDPTVSLDQRSRHPPLFPESQETRMRQPGFGVEGASLSSMPPPVARTGMKEGWGSSGSQDNSQQNDTSQTPSSHRRRLANGSIPGMGLASQQQVGRTASAPLAQQRGTSARQPLTGLSPNGAGNYTFTGYGMSTGVKVSHPVAAAQTNDIGVRPMVRSRVAQRPGSAAFMNNRVPAFGLPSDSITFGQENGYN